jgi:hypothetical protein
MTEATDFRPNQHVAVYWGRNEKDEPEFYYGTILKVERNKSSLVVELYDGTEEVIPAEEWNLLIRLNKEIPTAKPLTKKQVAAAKYVDGPQDGRTYLDESFGGKNLGFYVIEEDGEFKLYKDLLDDRIPKESRTIRLAKGNSVKDCIRQVNQNVAKAGKNINVLLGEIIEQRVRRSQNMDSYGKSKQSKY